VRADVIDHINRYVNGIPGTMRSSLLIDLSQGKRIEVDALQGSIVRRAAAAKIPVPIMTTLYALLKPFAAGPPQSG
jgi:2-dehydropantoate 2-reductase